MSAAARGYLTTYFALLALLAATVAASRLSLGPASAFISLAIAAAKAFLIVSVFMRAREGPPLVRLAAGVGVFWLVLLFGLMATDYATRVWIWHRP